MAVEKTYTCDICKDAIKPENLTGLGFDGGYGVIEKPIHDCNRHICDLCLHSLATIAADKNRSETASWGAPIPSPTHVAPT